MRTQRLGGYEQNLSRLAVGRIEDLGALSKIVKIARGVLGSDLDQLDFVVSRVG
jgi:hypothetical protein